MKRLAATIACGMLVCGSADAAPKWIKKAAKTTLNVLEHAGLGSGTYFAVSYAAGGTQHWPAGLVAAGIVAAVKEGGDAVAGRDTPRQAATHAAEIFVLGAGVSAAAKH